MYEVINKKENKARYFLGLNEVSVHFGYSTSMMSKFIRNNETVYDHKIRKVPNDEAQKLLNILSEVL